MKQTLNISAYISLSQPTLATTFFVHSAVNLMLSMSTTKSNCRTYIAKLLSYIETPVASDEAACRTMANILMKAQVLDSSDREKDLGCLRRKEKLNTEVIKRT